MQAEIDRSQLGCPTCRDEFDPKKISQLPQNETIRNLCNGCSRELSWICTAKVAMNPDAEFDLDYEPMSFEMIIAMIVEKIISVTIIVPDINPENILKETRSTRGNFHVYLTTGRYLRMQTGCNIMQYIQLVEEFTNIKFVKKFVVVSRNMVFVAFANEAIEDVATVAPELRIYNSWDEARNALGNLT